LAPLAGTFVSPAFGKAVLGQEGVALVLTLQASKAALRLETMGRRHVLGQACAG
jgi:hypothetical protein